MPSKSSKEIKLADSTKNMTDWQHAPCLMFDELCSIMFNVCLVFTDSLKIYVANTCRKTDYCRCINLKIVLASFGAV